MQHIVKSPDGVEHIINAPDDATQEQIMQMAPQIIAQGIEASPDMSIADKMKHIGGLAIRSAGIAAGGLADVPSMALNAGQWVGEQYTGRNDKALAPYPSEYINKAMDVASVPKPEGIVENVAVYGAPLIAGAGTSLVKGGVNMIKGMAASSPEEMSATGQAIKSVATKAYQKMRGIGATLSDDAALNIDTNIKKELAALGEEDAIQHAGTISALKGLEKKILGGNISLEALDQSRRTLEGVIRGDTTKNMITGAAIGYGEDALRAKKAIKAIDDSVNALKAADLNKGSTDAIKALNEARGAWSTQRKYQDMSRLIKDSGGNPNNLKLRLTRLANSDAKMKNFTAAEQQAIRNAAHTTGGEQLLNLAGKFGIDLGSSTYQGRMAGGALTLGAAKMAQSSLETGALDPSAMITAVGAVAGGTAARQVQKWIASGKAEDILKIIKSGQKLTPSQIGKLSPRNATLYINSFVNPARESQNQ